MRNQRLLDCNFVFEMYRGSRATLHCRTRQDFLQGWCSPEHLLQGRCRYRFEPSFLMQFPGSLPQPGLVVPLSKCGSHVKKEFKCSISHTITVYFLLLETHSKPLCYKNQTFFTVHSFSSSLNPTSNSLKYCGTIFVSTIRLIFLPRHTSYSRLQKRKSSFPFPTMPPLHSQASALG